ncbi:MAG: hypothetical protein WCO05_04785 [Candidatus Moraniibacteriota bacterium]
MSHKKLGDVKIRHDRVVVLLKGSPTKYNIEAITRVYAMAKKEIPPEISVAVITALRDAERESGIDQKDREYQYFVPALENIERQVTCYC